MNPIKGLLLVAIFLVFLSLNSFSYVDLSANISAASTGYNYTHPNQFSQGLNFTVISGLGSTSNITKVNITAQQNATLNMSHLNVTQTSTGSCDLYNSSLVNCTMNFGANSSAWIFISESSNASNTSFELPYFNISIYDNSSSANSTTVPLWIDGVAPTIVVGHNLTRNASIVNATINISVNVTDQTRIQFVNVSLHQLAITQPGQITGSGIQCYENISVDTATLNILCHHDDGVEFRNETGGPYDLYVYVSDVLNNISLSHSIHFFRYYNAQSSNTYNSSKFNVSTVRWGQNRQNYSIPIPFFGGENPNPSTGEVFPMYVDKPFFQGPDVQENLAYNLTVQLNASNLAANREVIQINLSLPGMIPALMQNFTVYTPEGTQNVTMIAPAMSGDFQGQSPENQSFVDQFTIWYNNTQYTSNIALSSTQLINGTYPATQQPLNGTVTLQVNATNNTVTNISIMFVERPPVNITNQTIVGFDMSGPPELGGNVTAWMYVNVSGMSYFYSADNISLDFMFPFNATEFYPGGTNQTFNITSNLTLRVYNTSSDAWELGNESGWTNYWTNISGCFNVTKNMSGAPDNGANITVCMTGYKFYISNQSRRTLDWVYGSGFAVNVSAFLQFPIMSESAIPSGGEGSNEYRCTVNMGTEAGIEIPVAKTPGIAGSGVTRSVYVDGRQLSSDQFSVASPLQIFGISLSQGAHDIRVVYTVPATSTPPGGAGGSGAPSGEAAETVIKESALVSSVGGGETGTFNFPGETDLTSIDLTVTNAVEDVRITVIQQDTLPIGVSSAPSVGTLYNYLDIMASNIQSNDINTVVINFKVSRQWLVSNSFMSEVGTWLTPESGTGVSLQMYSEGAWMKLSTVQTDMDNETVYFEATAPYFGDAFAITAEELGVTEDCRTLGCDEGYECKLVDGTYQCSEISAVCDITCPEGQTLDEETCECKGVYVAGLDYIWVMIVIAAVLTFIILFTYRSPIKEKFSMNPLRK